MVKKGFLVNVSKPNLGSVGENWEDDADEDLPP
jgi:hypothetical protein